MQAAGLDLPQRFFTWCYRRLGKSYPAIFMALELQTAWFITLGLLALLNLYYDVPDGDLLLLLAITLGLTGITVLVAFARSLRFLRPLARWIESDRQDTQLAGEAWETAVGLPLELIRRDMKLPVFGVAIPGSIAGVIILDKGPLDLIAIFAAAMVAIGYSGILHYFAIETGMRPVVADINRVVPPRLSTGHKPIPLRWKLMVALPMINIITGLINDDRTGALGPAGPLDHAADPRPRAGDRKGPARRIRRLGSSNHRRRARRALRRLQPDGQRSRRA
jgi:adenylate cyclase